MRGWKGGDGCDSRTYTMAASGVREDFAVWVGISKLPGGEADRGVGAGHAMSGWQYP